MAISDYALVSVPEFKDHSAIQGPGKDTTLENIINRVSDEIEQYLDRQIVTRGELTEYHGLRNSAGAVFASDLRTLEWPIISVTTVHEDTAWPRTYGASYLLTDATEYETVKPTGIIRRLNTSFGPTYWNTGHRAVQVILNAGYANTAAVPERIKAQALRYATLVWAETQRDQHGVSGASDSLGNWTRFSAAKLTDDMMAALTSERRLRAWESGERAA